jgi:hypothetical protein
MLTLMAWAVCARRDGESVNLNNARLNRVFAFSDDLEVRRLKDGFQNFRQDVGLPHYSVPLATLHHTRKQLASRNRKAVIRGKFELWFLINFYRQLIAHMETAANGLGGTIEIPVRLEMTNAVAVLAPYTGLPESLQYFLHRHLGI